MQISASERLPFQKISLDDRVSSIKINTSKPNQIYTLIKKSDSINSYRESLQTPLTAYSKNVTGSAEKNENIDRGDEEYIKVLKQAILEVICENELVFFSIIHQNKVASPCKRAKFSSPDCKKREKCKRKYNF